MSSHSLHKQNYWQKAATVNVFLLPSYKAENAFYSTVTFFCMKAEQCRTVYDSASVNKCKFWCLLILGTKTSLLSFHLLTRQCISGHTKQNLGLLTIHAATAQFTISIEVGMIRTLQLEAISLAWRLFPSRFRWDSKRQDNKGSLNG